MADRERWRYRDWLDIGRGRQQGGSPATWERDYYGREGRGSQRVSPGGEYLSRPSPDFYRSEGYTDQGYGENRGRGDWRTEDRYGPGSDYEQGEYSGFGEYGGYERFGPTPGEGPSQQPTGQHRGRGPRGYRRSDTRIHEEVCDRLTDDPDIDASSMDVTIENGEVTLAGTVDSRTNKRRAEDIAAEVSGVRDVHNRLRISAEPTGGERTASPGARH